MRLPFTFPTEQNGRPVTDIFSYYAPSDIDDVNAVEYYGYLSSAGGWMIQCNDSVNGTLRYAAGNGDYAANWSNRASLTYSLFSDVF